ncbi:MAG: GNAT family N-acetyltransferase [Chloroflexi bacterium]|nr:GNAT family N-acetyltransferase [Chloroflexota bacterium]
MKARDEVDLRDMTIDDLSAVYHLGEELFLNHQQPILYRIWDAYEVTGYFNSDPEFCLVAEDNGQVGGFALGTIFEKQGSAWKYGYVAWLGVRAEYRRRGLGARLYKELEKRMQKQGVRMVIMDTEEHRQDAVAFFHRMGFKERESHLWMAKTLRRSASPRRLEPVDKRTVKVMHFHQPTAVVLPRQDRGEQQR